MWVALPGKTYNMKQMQMYNVLFQLVWECFMNECVHVTKNFFCSFSSYPYPYCAFCIVQIKMYGLFGWIASQINRLMHIDGDVWPHEP